MEGAKRPGLHLLEYLTVEQKNGKSCPAITGSDVLTVAACHSTHSNPRSFLQKGLQFQIIQIHGNWN